jgi:hypothetical protein
VFDVDATRQAARQRSLPPVVDFMRSALQASPDAQRGEVVRTRTVALQMHTRQWIGTYAGRGNRDSQGELALALRAIASYLKLFALPPEVALVRLDGQYGDAAAVTLLIKAGVHLVTRARGYPVSLRGGNAQAICSLRGFISPLNSS